MPLVADKRLKPCLHKMYGVCPNNKHREYKYLKLLGYSWR